MFEFFFDSYKDTSIVDLILEIIVFVFGILSVWYAKKENLLVFPTGILATIISVYLLYKAGYFGDMILNAYYSIMSVYGWYMWTRKNKSVDLVQISRTNGREKLIGLGLFCITVIFVYIIYQVFNPVLEFVNYVDLFTSGIFFTAMYYMALKKIENWVLWLIGNLISIPLYAYRGLGIIACQFIIFTFMVIIAYISWYKILKQQQKNIQNG
ncbi:nicotinamide riboside transporter PnuC [Myroides sp. LJL116]